MQRNVAVADGCRTRPKSDAASVLLCRSRGNGWVSIQHTSGLRFDDQCIVNAVHYISKLLRVREDQFVEYLTSIIGFDNAELDTRIKFKFGQQGLKQRKRVVNQHLEVLC